MKDFKIGDVVRCIESSDWYEDPLVIGNDYEIIDIDFHFVDKICVKLSVPYYFHKEFVPDKFFDLKSKIREDKINEILKTF